MKWDFMNDPSLHWLVHDRLYHGRLCLADDSDFAALLPQTGLRETHQPASCNQNSGVKGEPI